MSNRSSSRNSISIKFSFRTSLPSINSKSQKKSLLVGSRNGFLRPSNNSSVQDNPTQNIQTYQITSPTTLNEKAPQIIKKVSSTSIDTSQIFDFDNYNSITNFDGQKAVELFVKKLKQCEQMCDFSSDIQEETIKAKTSVLTDIFHAIAKIDFVSHLKEEHYSLLYQVFIKNVYRIPPEPPIFWKCSATNDFTIDIVQERSWAHLELMYDMIITFFKSPQFRFNYCPKEIIDIGKRIFTLFKSPDRRECDKLQKLLYTMYRFFPAIRPHIRHSIIIFFRNHIFHPFPTIGIDYILNGLIPIISGFQVPILPENLELFSAILPLHGSPYLAMFGVSLTNSIIAFLNKDCSLVLQVLNSIFKFWPFLSSFKQTFFFNELNLIIHYFILFSKSLNQNTLDQNHEIKSSIINITQLVSKCVNSPHIHISEAALTLWKNPEFSVLITNNSNLTYSLLIPNIYLASTQHWSENIRYLATNVLRVLKSSNCEAFSNVGIIFPQLQYNESMTNANKGMLWKEYSKSVIDEKEEFFNQVDQIFGEVSKSTPLKESNVLSLSTIDRSSPIKEKSVFASDSNIMLPKEIPHRQIRKLRIPPLQRKVISVPKSLTGSQPHLISVSSAPKN